MLVLLWFIFEFILFVWWDGRSGLKDLLGLLRRSQGGHPGVDTIYRVPRTLGPSVPTSVVAWWASEGLLGVAHLGKDVVGDVDGGRGEDDVG